jgi:hypothetical protein
MGEETRWDAEGVGKQRDRLGPWFHLAAFILPDRSGRDTDCLMQLGLTHLADLARLGETCWVKQTRNIGKAWLRGCPSLSHLVVTLLIFGTRSKLGGGPRAVSLGKAAGGARCLAFGFFRGRRFYVGQTLGVSELEVVPA